MHRTVSRVVLGFLLIAVSTAAIAQEDSIEDHLVLFTQRLRLSLTLATIAANAPTLLDSRLHAQQLINLLEGAEGRHYVRETQTSEEPTGLLNDLEGLRPRFDQASLAPALRATVAASAKNVSTFLGFALSAALDGLSQRRLEAAKNEMLRAYAFLLAAYEKPCDASYVPGLWTILRAYGLATLLETGQVI